VNGGIAALVLARVTAGSRGTLLPASSKMNACLEVMALRIGVCVRRYRAGGKEMGRVSGVWCLFGLPDPLHTLLLPRVAANFDWFLSLGNFM